tara:strand:+ start:182 stop:619 length:438 start_codon:yes stop_codon:yes gene_type:complete
MKDFIFNDGGRAKAGYKGKAEDCVVRAIAIATETNYQKVYDDITKLNKNNNKKGKKTSARDGNTNKKTINQYLKSKGWKWNATMGIGTGCKTHLKKDELPKGKIICRITRHIVAVINGVIHDTYNCSRNGTRCVYGYWIYEVKTK